MRTFFGDKEMQTPESNDTKPKELNPDQKKLVALMIPVVKEYSNSKSTKVTEDVELALTVKVEALQEFMAAIAANKQTQKKELSANQKKLVTLMIPVVNEYSNSESINVAGDVASALTAKVAELQGLMGAIAAEITNEQNRKIAEAIEASDESPTSGF